MKKRFYNADADYLTQTEAAHFIGVYPNSFVRYYVKTGQIPFKRIGQRKMYSVRELRKLRDERIKFHPEDYTKDGKPTKFIERTNDKYFNTCGASKYVGISYSKFVELVDSGSVKFDLSGNRKVFTRDNLDVLKKEWKKMHPTKDKKGNKNGK